MLRKLVDLITSLKLTIACLAAAMVLVLAGTFAQVHFGIHVVQQRYFQSLFVWWPPEGRGFKIPIFPGGYLVGGQKKGFAGCREDKGVEVCFRSGPVRGC